MRGDNTKELKVVATCGGRSVQKTVRLSINPTPTPVPPPAPAPHPDPQPQPQPAPSPSIPPKPTEPVEMTNFKINIRRTSGFAFIKDDIYFNIYEKDTNKQVAS